tara:strand:- start:190 stop:408 length:219 start_codon:yes stop_codon:yes gene_type:complete
LSLKKKKLVTRDGGVTMYRGFSITLAFRNVLFKVFLDKGEALRYGGVPNTGGIWTFKFNYLGTTAKKAGTGL